MTSTVQMNVRMDADLKKRGDEALASIGLTPSETVRAVWRTAAERKEGLEDIRRFVGGNRGTEPNISDSRTRSLKEIWSMVDAFKKERGLDKAVLPDKSDKELYEEALVERLQERGLW